MGINLVHALIKILLFGRTGTDYQENGHAGDQKFSIHLSLILKCVLYPDIYLMLMEPLADIPKEEKNNGAGQNRSSKGSHPAKKGKGKRMQDAFD
jgi:hypothetical protein